ncbi:exopolysaccharide biosynthesis protein [Halomonas sp. GXIMD04776]|uniref:exopolysaccharide biosynthesis protein n=1 Tax=Halomonas sp. GXIMD04776 TaxID=3415605 RepID=UPI003CB7A4D4
MAQGITLTQLIEQLDEADSGETIRLQDIVDNFETRGFGPLLVLPALIVVLPTGAIPGIPTLCGLFITMVAAQMMMGKSSPWLPQRLSQRGFSHDKFSRAVTRLKPWTQRIDKLLKPRLQRLVNPLSTRLIAALAVALALSMLPLELVPFAAALPALAITLMGLGLAARDGLLMAFGLVVVVAGGLFLFQWLFS